MVESTTSSTESASTSSLVSNVDLWVFLALLLSCCVYHIRHIAKIPIPALLLLAGICLRAVGQYVGMVGDAVVAMDNIEAETILLIFLPALIFECSFSTDWYTFKREIWQIALLATTAVVVSSILTALVIRYVLGYSSEFGWYTAVMLGAILSATDHVAVVAQLKEVQADYRLETLIQGETLANEGSVIVIFTVMLSGAFESAVTSGDIVAQFFRLSLGGIALGLGFGVLLSMWLKRVLNKVILETLLTVIATYLLYFTAEATSLHFSGATATVTLGLFMSAYGKTLISPLIENTLHEFWRLLGHVFESLIFNLGGMLLVRFCTDFQSLEHSDIGMLFALFAMLHVVRAVTILMHWPFLRMLGYGCSYKEMIVLILSSLKGSISIALALMVYHENQFGERVRDLVLFWCVGISALSIIFDSILLHKVVRLLGLESMSDVQESMLVSVTAAILESTDKCVKKMKTDPRFSLVNWETVMKAAGPEMLLIAMVRETCNGKKLLKKSHGCSVQDILRDYNETVNITERDIMLETRRRYYTTLKGLYWHQFEHGQCFGDSALLLIESANQGLDNEETEMNDWVLLEPKLLPSLPLMRFLNLAARLPLIGRYFKQLQYNYIIQAYDVSRNFIRAHEEAEELLDEMEVDIRKDVFEQVMVEPHHQIELAKQFLTVNIMDIYPEVYIYVQTKQVSYTILYDEKAAIEQAYTDGVITEHEYSALITSVSHTITNMQLHTSPHLPSLMEMLKSCSLFADLSDQELQQIATGTKEDMVEKGAVLFKEHSELNGIFILLKGRVREQGDSFEQVHSPGAVIGVQYLLPNLPHVQTIAQAVIRSNVAFIPSWRIKEMLKNADFEKKVWIQGARQAIRMKKEMFGVVGLLDQPKIDILLSNCFFAKYAPDSEINSEHSFLLLHGKLSSGQQDSAFVEGAQREKALALEPSVLLHFTEEFGTYMKSSTFLTFEQMVNRFTLKGKLPALKISNAKLQLVKQAGVMLLHKVIPNITSAFLNTRRSSLSRVRVSPQIGTQEESEQCEARPLESQESKETEGMKDVLFSTARTKSGLETARVVEEVSEKAEEDRRLLQPSSTNRISTESS